VISTFASPFAVAMLGGLLWWFIRDRMKTKDREIKEAKERAEAVAKEATEKLAASEKRDAEVQKYRELAEQERHQAAMQHYASIEGRLKAGSESFSRQQVAMETVNNNITAVTNEFRDAVRKIQTAITEMAIRYVPQPDFKEFAKRQEEKFKQQDMQFEKMKESQDALVTEVRNMSVKFDATMTAVNGLVKGLIDEKMAQLHRAEVKAAELKDEQDCSQNARR
jgi:uncharacterized phage infection (PIP) family protein YhgE